MALFYLKLQAKHIVPSSVIQTVIVEVVPLVPTESNTPSSSSSTSARSLASSVSHSWPENFRVPWNLMPPGIQSAVEHNQRPSPADRRQRVLADEMRKHGPSPTRSQCLNSHQIVRKYPETFADMMDDRQVRGGYESLLSQLKVYAEFQRITNQNLPNTFYSELDRHLPRLMTLFRQKASRTGKTSDTLTEILRIHDEQEFHGIHTKCVTVLHALPVYLREDVSGFLRTCMDTSDEPELLDVAVALLTVVKDNDTSPVHFQTVKISVVIENEIVGSLSRFADAFLQSTDDHTHGDRDGTGATLDSDSERPREHAVDDSDEEERLNN
ncbi:hypothetical protein Q8A67_006337 [Cirrhinus molitorella]|uniref:Uncharacterized protein n=1 Tax=Cirrhinus molitorella TaxID=172907 RepID=A0AA88Q4W5_9TELE|nr:hypothetical protein Q8A67_006337 [Cirrhinus molitorella]